MTMTLRAELIRLVDSTPADQIPNRLRIVLDTTADPGDRDSLMGMIRFAERQAQA